ncbi:hypothetical protein [Mucisphaera calidilacus]|uniref:DUF1772 domain-containing protein n=1 Tax=Mucisphaera calidilacus TaxID=2527982 RepID=A0A518BVH7_9BACT|nr:hypothetical protein [Mucisphaera calidilacus]QDU70979.1 hypothetical protein Pan265_08230 [Mucisphaera calidilacus]
MTWLLLVHAGVTCYMAGLICLIQRVHYPLMDRVPSEGFASFATEHQQRILPVVGPTMLVEGVCAAALVAVYPASWLVWAGLVLVLVNGVSTALVQVPLHTQLARGFDAVAHRRLVMSNWVRTVAWTARAVLSLVMVAVLG